MRVNRLDLIRYGKFTERSLDFGVKPRQGPDLHVVYGPNEAGKSTLFAGMLDLFYGIEARSAYGFLHRYETMRIGATLLIDGQERRFIRVKKQQGLLDGQERPLPEAALAGALGGLGRDACRTIFSLDAETLKAGGRDILASKGDLGQLLFSASAGLADLSRKLAEIDAELDAFHAPQKRASQLAEMKRRADALKAARDDIDVTATAYVRLDEARRQAETDDAAAAAAHAAAAAQGARLAVQAEGMRLLGEHRALADETAAARERAAALVSALAHAARAEALREYTGNYRELRLARPNRESERAEAEQAVHGLLVHLGRPDHEHPRELLLDAAQRGALTDLIARKAALEARAEAARDAVAAARTTLEDADSALAAQEPPTGGAVDGLKAALAALRADDSAVRRRQAQSRAAKAADALAHALEALSPWEGDADALARLDAPEPADVAAAGAALARAAQAEEAARAALEHAAAELARQRAAVAALGDMAALRDGADHGAIRAARETLWAAHRRAFADASADAFETAMRRDDMAGEARLTQAGAIARAAELRLSAAAAEAGHGQCEAALETAAARAAEAREQLARIVAAASPALKAGMSAEAFAAWLRRRDGALALRAEQRDAMRDAAEAAAQEKRLSRRLLETLAAAGRVMPDDADAPGLAQAADELVLAAASLRNLAESRERLARDLRSRREALAKVEADAAAWDDGWRAACGGCWLGELSPLPGLSHAAAILDRLVRLEAALDARAYALDRLDKIERDQRRFEEDVAALAADFGAEPGSDPLAELQAIGERIAAARTAAERRDRLAERLAAVEAELLRRMDAASLDDARNALSGVDAAGLSAAQAGLALRLPELDRARLTAFSALNEARKAQEAVGGDDRAARLAAERANHLLAMREEAERHLRLRLGALAVRQALRSYRDRHRSSMLEAASAAFALMTRQAYAGLSAQSDGGAEKLVAIAADGASREADQLSTGTQAQLYLALRVAGHREFARQRTPLPFVCDDILETFDDMRGDEALKLMAGMAEHGQVICLTHNRFWVDRALAICPGARLHEL